MGYRILYVFAQLIQIKKLAFSEKELRDLFKLQFPFSPNKPLFYIRKLMEHKLIRRWQEDKPHSAYYHKFGMAFRFRNFIDENLDKIYELKEKFG